MRMFAFRHDKGRSSLQTKLMGIMLTVTELCAGLLLAQFCAVSLSGDRGPGFLRRGLGNCPLQNPIDPVC